MAKTKRELATAQIAFQSQMQSEAKVNLVTCGNCGTIQFHLIDDSEKIKCFGCMRDMAKSDCPDYWTEGEENSVLYD